MRNTKCFPPAPPPPANKSNKLEKYLSSWEKWLVWTSFPKIDVCILFSCLVLMSIYYQVWILTEFCLVCFATSNSKVFIWATFEIPEMIGTLLTAFCSFPNINVYILSNFWDIENDRDFTNTIVFLYQQHFILLLTCLHLEQLLR